MIPGDFGTLHLPVLEGPAPEAAQTWLSVTPNALVVSAAVLLTLLNFSGYLRLRPHLFDCLTKKRGAENLEHNLQSARERNFCVLTAFLALCALCDRFGLYRPDWIDGLPKAWSLAATCGAILGFHLLRLFIHVAAKPKRLRADAVLATRRIQATFAIPLAITSAATVGVLLLFNASDACVRAFLYIEIILLFLWCLFREFQILGEKYSALPTFLYLCALEILPAAAFVVSAVLL